MALPGWAFFEGLRSVSKDSMTVRSIGCPRVFLESGLYFLRSHDTAISKPTSGNRIWLETCSSDVFFKNPNRKKVKHLLYLEKHWLPINSKPR